MSQKPTFTEAGLIQRAQLHPTNLLDEAAALLTEMDLIWMSQFLSCFSEREQLAVSLAARRRCLLPVVGC